MKTLRYILVMSMVVAMFSACSSDSESGEIKGNYPKDNVVRINTLLSAPLTKAGEQTYRGNTLGLFLDYDTEGNHDTYTKNNVLWTNNNGTWTSASLMLWKSSKTPVNIYAYAPYNDNIVSPEYVTWSIPSDQTSGIASADLVWFGKQAFVPIYGLDGMESVQIVFKHALVKLNVNLIKGNEYTDNDKIASVVLKRTAGTVVCDLTKSGDITIPAESYEQDITMHPLTNTSYEAVFYPYKGQQPNEEMLVVTMASGTVYSYVVPVAGLDFQKGCAYTMTLKIGKDKITIANPTTLNPWIITDEPGGEAEKIDVI